MYEKDNGSNLDHFTETLNMIRRRHLDTVPTMAQAVFKLNSINTSEGLTDTVQYFLDRLYTNRLVNIESFRLFLDYLTESPSTCWFLTTMPFLVKMSP